MPADIAKHPWVRTTHLHEWGFTPFLASPWAERFIEHISQHPSPQHFFPFTSLSSRHWLSWDDEVVARSQGQKRFRRGACWFFLAQWGQETVCFTCCHSLTPNSIEIMIDTLYLLNKYVNKWGNKWTSERMGWCSYLLEMNSTGPCRPDNLGSIFPQHPSKFSNSSTFFFCQAGYKVQAICDVDLHPVALRKAKPLGSHFQHRGVDLHSMDAGLWEMIVDKEREAAPAQAYHQQCQWGLCNKA